MKNSYVKLKDVAKLEWGNTSITKSSYVEVGFPAFSAAGSDGYLKHAEFEEDGIVLSAIGARCGKCFKAHGKWTAIKNTITIIPNKEQVDLNYLFTQLNDEKSWKISGAAQPFITLANVRDRLIQLPPLVEQQRIAALLDTADRILKQRESAITKLDQLAQSVFVDMLGDLNINSKNLSLVKLKNICTYSQGLQVDVSKQYENKLTENDVRFLRIIDFTQGNQQPRYIENPSNKYYLHENEIAMVRYGATGFVCNGLSGVIANNLFKISIKDENFHPKYMLMYFKSDYFQQKLKSLNVGVAMPAINFRTLDVFEVPFVSYDDQMKLVDIHTTISENILFHKKNLEKLHSLFRSLQHQSFAVN